MGLPASYEGAAEHFANFHGSRFVNFTDPRITKFHTEVYPHVSGWLQGSVLWSLCEVAAFQESIGVRRASCEIGVHHGRFALALEAITPDSEAVYALDVFERQDLNIDNSGLGDRATFEKNVASYARNARRVEVVALDSTSASAAAFFRKIEGSVSLFSIDGGHTRAHATCDLLSSELAICDGGVVYLDDYFNPGWPGVTEGLLEYWKGSHRLLPVASIGGKLILAHMSFAARLIKHMRDSMVRDNVRARGVSFGGYSYLAARV